VRTIVGFVIAVVVGVSALVSGVADATTSEVTCGTRVVSPGDTCTVHRTRGRPSRTYDYQQLGSSRVLGIVVRIGLGLFLLLLPGAAVLARRRRRRGRLTAS
jgi:hypothetical protein